MILPNTLLCHVLTEDCNITVKFRYLNCNTLVQACTEKKVWLGELAVLQ